MPLLLGRLATTCTPLTSFTSPPPPPSLVSSVSFPSPAAARRAELQFYVTEVEVANVSTGVGGIAGNKGGVGVSLQLGETTMCFVCCHLAAHQEHVPQRNADFREISKSMALGFKELDLSNQFDILFWMGDVNYRIDMDKPTVLDLIAAGDFETLLAADQLGIERSHGNAFAGFSEGDIAFPPTYRYQVCLCLCLF